MYYHQLVLSWDLLGASTLLGRIEVLNQVSLRKCHYSGQLIALSYRRDVGSDDQIELQLRRMYSIEMNFS